MISRFVVISSTTPALLWLIVLSLLLCAETFAAEPDLRAYSEGALTADDFRARPDAAEPRWARIKTELRYDYRYQYEEREKIFTLWLTQANVTAHIDRALSWNKRLDDAKLLAHEQGHFDLAHVQALTLAREFQRRLSLKDATFRVQAKSVAEGVMQLEAMLKQLVTERAELLRLEDAKYDAATKHGVTLEAQQEWEAKLRQQIETLTDELKQRKG